MQDLCQLYQDLGSLRAVAKKTGLSHEGVRQRLLSKGAELNPRSQQKVALGWTDEDIAALYQSLPPGQRSTPLIGQYLGCSKATAARRIRRIRELGLIPDPS